MNAPAEIILGRAQSLPAPLLAALYVFRQHVFGESLRWQEEREGRDCYDQFDPVHVIARRDGRVVGCLRLMPTEGPCMTYDAFPHLLDETTAHRGPEVWELSRFAATAGDEAADPQCACAGTARALFEHTLIYARAHDITRVVGVATVPVLAFASELGLAPRTALKKTRPAGNDAPVAFMLDMQSPANSFSFHNR
jgi:acyl homoserine lactone synthase